MKKFLVMILVTITVLSFGCGSEKKEAPAEQTTIKTEQKAQEKKVEEKKEVASVKVPKLCPMAGIGDTLDDWTKDYGKPNRDNGLTKNFMNDDLITAVADDRVLNITIQCKDESKAIGYLKYMLPKDGKFVSEKAKKDSTTAEITKEYTSENLKKAIKSNLTGHYSVSEIRDNKDSHFIMFVIDCTPTLEEINKAKKQ